MIDADAVIDAPETALIEIVSAFCADCAVGSVESMTRKVWVVMIVVLGVPVGVPLITPLVESNVRPGPGGPFPTIDQTYGGFPPAAANVTVNGLLMVPFIGEPVVIANTVGPGAGGGADALLTSLQPLKPHVVAQENRIVHKRCRFGFPCCAIMIPLCRYDVTAYGIGRVYFS